MAVRVRVLSLSSSVARIPESGSMVARSDGMHSWILPSSASKGASVRPTFTLHDYFRYARSTFFDLYLNHKSRLSGAVTWSRTVSGWHWQRRRFPPKSCVPRGIGG